MQLSSEESRAAPDSLESTDTNVGFIEPDGTPHKLVGFLAHTPLPEVLQEISSRELSGDLQFISKGAVRAVYFDHGFVVFAGSNRRKDRLGPRLLQAGKVTRRELTLAARLLKYKRRIGEAMVEIGLLSEEELGQEVARQVRQIILSLFSSKDAVFIFDQRECAIPMELRLSLSIYRIQLEGIRRMNDQKLILKGLGSLDRRVRLSDLPPFSFEESELWTVEREVMEAAECGEVLNRIPEIIGEHRIHCLRAAYGLLCAGILELEGSGKRELKVQEEMGTFLLSEMGKKVGDVVTSDLRQEVLLQFDALEQASPFELLRVDESATEDQIQRAFRQRQQEWETKQTIIDTEKTLTLKVEEIKRRIAAAHARALAAKKAPEVSAVETDDDDLSRDEDLVWVVHPPEEGSLTSVTEREGLDTSTPEVSTSVEMEPVPETGLESTARPAKPAGDEEINREVKRLLYDIKVRRAINDDEGAISLLYELVELQPESVKFTAMLANALAEHPVLCKRAERHFRRALALDPQNADLHYSLGRYYFSYSMRSRALAEYKTALRIDPRHAEARAALVELKKDGRTPVDKFLRKFFN